jgi:YVTN family beta-propeller protein
VIANPNNASQASLTTGQCSSNLENQVCSYASFNYGGISYIVPDRNVFANGNVSFTPSSVFSIAGTPFQSNSPTSYVFGTLNTSSVIILANKSLNRTDFNITYNFDNSHTLFINSTTGGYLLSTVGTGFCITNGCNRVTGSPQNSLNANFIFNGINNYDGVGTEFYLSTGSYNVLVGEGVASNRSYVYNSINNKVGLWSNFCLYQNYLCSYQTGGGGGYLNITTKVTKGSNLTFTSPYAYVTNYGNNTVSVISTVSHVIIGTITGFNEPFQINFPNLDISPVTSNGVVSNFGNNTVSIINQSFRTKVGTITGFNEPVGVSFNPDGSLLYVSNYGNGTVSIVNTLTRSKVGTITGFNEPYDLHTDTSGQLLYVADFGDNSIKIVDLHSDTIVHTITGGFNEPSGITFDKQAGFGYVTNYGSGNVVILSISSNSVVGVVSGFTGSPSGIEFNLNGSFADVANYAGTNIERIESSTNSVVLSINMFDNPSGVDFPLVSHSSFTNYTNQTIYYILPAFTRNSVISGIIPTNIVNGGINLNCTGTLLNLRPCTFQYYTLVNNINWFVNVTQYAYPTNTDTAYDIGLNGIGYGLLSISYTGYENLFGSTCGKIYLTTNQSNGNLNPIPFYCYYNSSSYSILIPNVSKSGYTYNQLLIWSSPYTSIAPQSNTVLYNTWLIASGNQITIQNPGSVPYVIKLNNQLNPSSEICTAHPIGTCDGFEYLDYNNGKYVLSAFGKTIDVNSINLSQSIYVTDVSSIGGLQMFTPTLFLSSVSSGSFVNLYNTTTEISGIFAASISYFHLNLNSGLTAKVYHAYTNKYVLGNTHLTGNPIIINYTNNPNFSTTGLQNSSNRLNLTHTTTISFNSLANPVVLAAGITFPRYDLLGLALIIMFISLGMFTDKRTGHIPFVFMLIALYIMTFWQYQILYIAVPITILFILIEYSGRESESSLLHSLAG